MARVQAWAAMTWRTRSRGNKFNAKRTTIDGITFASQHEARRYQALRHMERAGVIQGLELQTRYPLVVNGVPVTSYRPDFQYVVSRTGEVITEDAKSGPTRTRDYIIRKKLMRAIHQIEITEV